MSKLVSFVVLRNVVNDSGVKHDLPAPVTAENIKQVWTILDQQKLVENGLKHHHGSFLEDRNHDWRITDDGKLCFYGHSGRKGERHDLALVYA